MAGWRDMNFMSIIMDIIECDGSLKCEFQTRLKCQLLEFEILPSYGNFNNFPNLRHVPYIQVESFN